MITTHDTAAEGRFAFTSQMGGEHQICLRTTTMHWQGTQRTFVRENAFCSLMDFSGMVLVPVSMTGFEFTDSVRCLDPLIPRLCYPSTEVSA